MDDFVTHAFTRAIDKAEERKLLRVPFEVLPDVESIRIAYEYQRHRVYQGEAGKTLKEEVNIVDLALEDAAHALIGASGSERREIEIYENHATNGYRGVPIAAGTWYIVLGAYKIEPQGCPVAITITQKKKREILLKGDCHIHSNDSDGWYPVDHVIERARQDRLDFIFLTDHNSMASNALIRSYPDLTVVPGVEVTYYDGHYNLFGHPRPILTYVANTQGEVIAIMREGKENGALLSLNHPMDKNCGWRFGFDEDIPADMIEIWNGPFTPWNMKCVELWHSHLCQGRIWPAIGGSDCHRAGLFHAVAAPATCLYAKSRAASDILAAMKAGHAYVGQTPNAPSIDMEMDNARMGDIVKGPHGKLKLTVGPLSERDEIRLINQHGTMQSERPGRCMRYESERDVSGSLFVRVEIWGDLPGVGQTLLSIGNPIYIR